MIKTTPMKIIAKDIIVHGSKSGQRGVTIPINSDIEVGDKVQILKVNK